LADKIFGHTSQIVSRGQNVLGYTLKEPIGVVGLIVPWNAPLRQTVYKVAPALAAGCSVVLKPAEETSLTGLHLAELISDMGIPAGVFNVVTGYGEPAGARLVEHGDVDKISFTGSTEIGQSIVRAAAGNLKKLTLELGGKSPLIVFDDADISLTVPAAAMAIFGGSGQVCSAASRVIIQRPVYDSVLSGIVEIGKKLKLGYCIEPGIDLGPLISSKQLERVSSYVVAGRADGAEVLTGGARLDREGFFFPPTVLSGVRSSTSVFQEEIFGPVLAAVPFDDLDEAVALANDTVYGLAASVFTQNVGRAHAVAHEFRAGRVGINIHSVTDFTMPGGGYKRSGWGRENGPDGIDPYLEVKSVFTLTE
jgi:acyl-CoA reductase-like NAD-dependent aldehyde dehydrogenase